MSVDPELHAFKKLEEASFFLNKIKFSQNDEYLFYVSAFLSAWRSVFDILLYDAAMYYELGFSREEIMKDYQFRWAAKRLNKEEALNFLSWWKTKLSKLSLNPLFEQRSIVVHRGIPDIEIPPFRNEQGKLPNEILEELKETYRKIDGTNSITIELPAGSTTVTSFGLMDEARESLKIDWSFFEKPLFFGESFQVYQEAYEYMKKIVNNAKEFLS